MNIGYNFINRHLLEIALTHSSMTFTHDNKIYNYERLEFLGDSVLNCIIAEKIYLEYPHCPEGKLSMILANLVSAQSIIKVAKKMNISPYIKISYGEKKNGKRAFSNILENVVEALIGAILLDSNYHTIRTVIYRWWKELLANTNILYKRDSKSRLQELSQKQFHIVPQYHIENITGLSHDPIFTVSVNVNTFLSTGRGRTRKLAEQNAAALMLKKLYNE